MKTHTLTRKINFDYRKGRLAENPIGLHVCMDYQNRHWLGEVRAIDASDGYVRLVIQHFNGDVWPFKPTAASVDVIG